MNADLSTPPTVTQRLDGMLSEIRGDQIRRDTLQRADRKNPMVPFVMGGALAEIERLRADAALQATVVAGLGEKLAEAREMNASLASDYVALQNECVEVGEVFGNDDTIGGESLSDYVRRQVTKLRERMTQAATLLHKLNGGGLTTHERMALMRDLAACLGGNGKLSQPEGGEGVD